MTKNALPTKESSTRLSRAIARRVCAVRQLREMTAEQLDEVAGLGRGLTCRIESGKRGRWLSVDVAVRYARALDVDVGWLITGVVPDGKWVPPLGAKELTAKPKGLGVTRAPARTRKTSSAKNKPLKQVIAPT